MKNPYLKKFLHRGLLFGGFGPIVAAIVLFFIARATHVTFGGAQLLAAVVSTYLLAFLHAGASVFNQIEHWSTAKSLLCHLGTLYVAYAGCYLVNAWIPFEPLVILIFTAAFAAVYFGIWLTVYLSVRAFSRRCNAMLRR